jgi:hypothetical protein
MPDLRWSVEVEAYFICVSLLHSVTLSAAMHAIMWEMYFLVLQLTFEKYN